MVERRVTHSLQVGERFFIFENVPARVCLETGEKFFAPDTVEKLYAIIHGQQPPSRLLEAAVYEFAA